MYNLLFKTSTTKCIWEKCITRSPNESVKDDYVFVSHKNVKLCAHICPHPLAKL